MHFLCFIDFGRSTLFRKKYQKDVLFKIWFSSSIIKTLKKTFFQNFYFIFCHWFLNQNQKHLVPVVPHIVQVHRGTAIPNSKKRAKSTHPTAQCTYDPALVSNHPTLMYTHNSLPFLLSWNWVGGGGGYTESTGAPLQFVHC